MTPAQRITKGLCPECEVSLDGLNIIGHARSHWPRLDKNDPNHAEAVKRDRMLLDYADTHKAPAPE